MSTIPPGWHYTPIDIFTNLEYQHYARLASMVVVFYDFLLTLDREVHYFWGKPLTIVNSLYFLNRYWGTLALAIDTWVTLAPQKSDSLCEFQMIFQSWSGLLSVLLVEAILMLRVHALFDRSNRATLALSGLFFTQTTMMTIILCFLFRELKSSSFLFGAACGALTKMPKWFALFWVPPVFTDTLLLVLTLYKAVSYHQLSFTRRNGGYRLFEILVRDQILYFVGILLVAVANIIAMVFEPLLICFAVGFVIGFPLIMGSRLLLNLREMAEKGPIGSIPSISLPTIHFAPSRSTRSEQILSTRSEII